MNKPGIIGRNTANVTITFHLVLQSKQNFKITYIYVHVCVRVLYEATWLTIIISKSDLQSKRKVGVARRNKKAKGLKKTTAGTRRIFFCISFSGYQTEKIIIKKSVIQVLLGIN